MEGLREGAFFAYLNEREAVRLRKEADEPYPWTQDSILRTYKFTNVRRHHDRTSRVLREKFYDPNFNADRKSILMNCALFRYFGTWEFAEAVGWQEYETFDFDGIEDIATMRLFDGERVFTGAYVITNQGISLPKQQVVVHYFLKDLWAKAPAIVQLAEESRSWREVSSSMREINGFGGTGFMTKEILLDTTYTGFWGMVTESEFGDGQFSFPKDWWFWTPIGPGALRGAGRVMDETFLPDLERTKERDAWDVIWTLYKNQHNFWDEDNRGRLSPTDIQFGLCEFDKYERVRLGQGRPRSKYRPK